MLAIVLVPEMIRPTRPVAVPRPSGSGAQRVQERLLDCLAYLRKLEARMAKAEAAPSTSYHRRFPNENVSS